MTNRSKWGTRVAVCYLILILIVCVPLILDGINHSTGLPYVAAMVLTTPFSWVLTAMLRNMTDPSTSATESIQYIGLGILGASALVNAAIVYYITVKFERMISKFAKRKNIV